MNRQRRRDEHAIQAGFVMWSRLFEKQFPGLELLHAIPNGGNRDIWTAARMKKEGVLAGMPDMCIPVRRNLSAALYIEFKAPGGIVSPVQKRVFALLEDYGNAVIICYATQAAIEATKEYLNV